MRPLLCVAALALSGGMALCQSTPTIKQTRIERTSPASAEDMYTKYCAVCHGKDGKGGGPAAAAMKKVPTDLTTLSKKNGGKFHGPAVSQSITGEQAVTAHGSANMPVWGTLFREDGQDESQVRLRIANLVKYIEKMQVK
ncbi:MAG: c-type cytochrome [Bryobacteraceae bacterium]|nr:c-type cytochrome [Bryobacteraceae bacterium]